MQCSSGHNKRSPTCYFTLEKLVFSFSHVLALFAALRDTQLCSHSVSFAFLFLTLLPTTTAPSPSASTMSSSSSPPFSSLSSSCNASWDTLQEMESDPDDEVNMGNRVNNNSGRGLFVSVLFVCVVLSTLVLPETPGQRMLTICQ